MSNYSNDKNCCEDTNNGGTNKYKSKDYNKYIKNNLLKLGFFNMKNFDIRKYLTGLLNKKTYDKLAKIYYENEQGHLFTFFKKALEIKKLMIMRENGIDEQEFDKFIQGENKKISPLKNNKVLELGCGTGLFSKIFGDIGFDVTGLDFSKEMIHHASLEKNDNVNFINADFLKHNFDNKFDLVNMMAFIHLFPSKQTKEILFKVKEILNPGGLVYLATTKENRHKQGVKIKIFPDNLKLRYRVDYTPEEFKKLLTDNGFEITSYQEIDDDTIPGKKWMDIIAKVKE